MTTLIGIGVFLLSVFLFIKKYQFVKSSEKTVGKIVEVVSHISESQDEDGYTSRTKMYTPILEFSDKNNKTYKFKAKISSSSQRKFKVGREIKVLYSSENPEKAEVNKFLALWAAPIIAATLAVALIIGGISSGT